MPWGVDKKSYTSFPFLLLVSRATRIIVCSQWVVTCRDNLNNKTLFSFCRINGFTIHVIINYSTPVCFPRLFIPKDKHVYAANETTKFSRSAINFFLMETDDILLL